MLKWCKLIILIWQNNIQIKIKMWEKGRVEEKSIPSRYNNHNHISHNYIASTTYYMTSNRKINNL